MTCINTTLDSILAGTLLSLLPRFQVAESPILHAPNIMKKTKAKPTATPPLLQ